MGVYADAGPRPAHPRGGVCLFSGCGLAFDNEARAGRDVGLPEARSGGLATTITSGAISLENRFVGMTPRGVCVFAPLAAR